MTREPCDEPTTIEEWQVAADLAHTYLCIDSARRYGLVEGGPVVNLERCSEILSKAADRGVEPRDDAFDRCLPYILAGE